MIRLAKEDDLNAIEKIYNALHDLEEQGLSTTGWQRKIYPTRNGAKAAVDAGEMYVLEAEGSIVAAAKINQEQEPDYVKVKWDRKASVNEIMVIHTLVVDPSYRGKGYAKSFMEFCESFAREKGCIELRLDTNERNKVARNLYKSLGFHEIGVVPTVFNGIEGVRLVMLEKSLI